MRRHEMVNRGMLTIAVAAIFALPTWLAVAAGGGGELPFKVTTLIIETTDNDIELQLFVDGNEWKRLNIFDPKEREIFNLGTLRNLGGQGLSEMHVASEPSHFPEDALAPSEEADEVVEAFLARFPAGDYEIEGATMSGLELEGVATLSHVLPALPEIVAPTSETDDPPVVELDEAVIEWEPVTTRFLGSGRIRIAAFQIIVEQVAPFRKLTIDLPASATHVTIQPEFLAPGKLYNFEVVAIEAGGARTISEGDFMTERTATR